MFNNIFCVCNQIFSEQQVMRIKKANFIKLRNISFINSQHSNAALIIKVGQSGSGQSGDGKEEKSPGKKQKIVVNNNNNGDLVGGLDDNETNHDISIRCLEALLTKNSFYFKNYKGFNKNIQKFCPNGKDRVFSIIVNNDNERELLLDIIYLYHDATTRIIKRSYQELLLILQLCDYIKNTNTNVYSFVQELLLQLVSIQNCTNILFFLEKHRLESQNNILRAQVISFIAKNITKVKTTKSWKKNTLESETYKEIIFKLSL